MSKDITSLADLTPDPRNARRHNPRNVGMIEKALGDVGAARSIVVDEAGVILAGNATVEAAMAAGMDRVQVVDADGQTIIAVRRSGLTPEQKIDLALFDNRSAELAEWSADVLAGLGEEIDLSTFWTRDEVEDIAEAAMLDAEIEAGLSMPASAARKLGDRATQIKPVLYVDEIDIFEQAIEKTGIRNRGQAVIAICQAYLDGPETR